MIIKKTWVEEQKIGCYVELGNVFKREGWFLFGIIPFYIRDVTTRDSR